MKVTTPSVEDIGRSLRLAREQARLTPEQAADQAGLSASEVNALESGDPARLRDRVETLRSLRVYAASLGLPGNDFVVALVDLWPAPGVLSPRPGDSGQVPVVSVSGAPAGGHSPAYDSGWPSELTRAAEFSVTGVMSPLGTLPVTEGVRPSSLGDEDTPDKDFDTGEIPAVRQRVPRALKVLVAFTVLMIAAGIFTLLEHSHFTAWQKSVHADSSRWFHDLKVDVGLSPKKTHHGPVAPPGTPPKVVITPNPNTSSVVVDVHASSFSVKMVAFKSPSWMEVNDSEQDTPIYQQVMAGGANQTFPVQHSLTVETGSASARAYIYEGTTFIGYYFPSSAPYTLKFNAVG
jgi:hypothetical protein